MITEASSAMAPSLPTLPAELIQLILSSLHTVDLKNVALVSHHLYAQAITPLWRTVCLVDTWKLHLNDATRHLQSERGNGVCDEHDDTPIIQKLFILARNPKLAGQVQVLIHRCHLPPPAILELPVVCFDNDDLSTGPRIHMLILLAVRNLTNVHTLGIIYGHRQITKALLGAFLDQDRPQHVPLRRLWLESCSFSGTYLPFLKRPDGLQSVRLRRLWAECDRIGPGRVPLGSPHNPLYRPARWGPHKQFHDGAGGFYETPVLYGHSGYPGLWIPDLLIESNQKAREFDDAIWNGLPEITEFILNSRLPQDRPRDFTYIGFSGDPILGLLGWLAEPSSTITSLNLDWILWRAANDEGDDEHARDEHARQILACLSRSRFPNLRAFQIRNAVTPVTRFPDNIYLLEATFLGFLEYHQRIECLAFPLDRFYSHDKPSEDVLRRSRQLVAHFSTVLVDLRVDSYYNRHCEPLTDLSQTLPTQQQRLRRRRFIAEFAPYMTKIEHIKLEGGIPRDEKLEILRALRQCPLKKIVQIGASFPAGNTWGASGEHLRAVDEGVQGVYDLEREDEYYIGATWKDPPKALMPFKFIPVYGHTRRPPPLWDIAAEHAETVEELKLCGFNGSPILSHPSPITQKLLYPLIHFHNLREIAISMYLITFFEDGDQDAQIIQSWKDIRSPTSTALVIVTPPASPQPPSPTLVTPTTASDFPSPAARPQSFNRWQVALKTKYSPSALAYRVAEDISPFLSSRALARKGGVKVRASFGLGVPGTKDIFNLDVRIGEGGKLLSFVGPREEGEEGRWWEKWESRRWFW